ncbi:GNAT family N-acetyltransferase [Pontimicrobium aquaticum]|uniref:GNAT family N-acetyltransferase n=1 Tax=Pontimicrobium aquaticum TaxID=2565367 RepID=A0A4U0EX51_9FLAO|nr:GNAT family protein [Pontimicrobium aquaticum]TJY35944.1 GNAT family N-acetyltransferase [Pontimicrobium aquaticum]
MNIFCTPLINRMLEFENYIIRPLVLEDLDEFFNLIETNRERLNDFFAGIVSKTKNIEATRVFLKEVIKKQESKQYFAFVVVDNTTNKLMAFIDLKNIDWTIPKTEIGCFTDKKISGKGITTKAIKTFLDYSFNHFKFKKIYLRTHHSNKAAQTLAEKCGFELEGIIRMDYKTTSGKIIDLMYYGLINNK